MKGIIMEELNEVVQDAKSLMTAANNHTASATEEGINPDDIQGLTAAIADTTSKNKLQQDAVQAVSDLTDTQNKTMERALALIRKTQAAAKGVYGEENKQIMKEFHVGSQTITTVKGMMSELKYMKGVAQTRLTDLTGAGFKQTDVDAFDTIGADLDDIDGRQENAKKKQKGATQVRDESMDALRKLMKKIRNKAKVIFQNKPAILTEFEPISIKRSGKKQGPVTSVTTAATVDKTK
jgi:endo-alpha-1,4-polygalactosaminidase (GH114 family)